MTLFILSDMKWHDLKYIDIYILMIGYDIIWCDIIRYPLIYFKVIEYDVTWFNMISYNMIYVYSNNMMKVDMIWFDIGSLQLLFINGISLSHDKNLMKHNVF